MNLLRVLAIIVIGLIAWPSAASAKPGDIKTMVLPFTGAKSKTLQTEVKNALEAAGRVLAKESNAPAPDAADGEFKALAEQDNIEAFVFADVKMAKRGWSMNFQVRSGLDGKVVGTPSMQAPWLPGLIKNIKSSLMEVLGESFTKVAPPGGAVEELSMDEEGDLVPVEREAPEEAKDEDEDEDEEDEGDEEKDDAGPSGPRPSPLNLGLNAGFVFRNLSPPGPIEENPYGQFQGHSGGFPAFDVAGEVYPAAFVTGSFVSNLGLVVAYEQSFAGSANVVVPDAATGLFVEQSISTSMAAFSGGLRVRFPFSGDKEFGFSGRYGIHSMRLDFAPGNYPAAPRTLGAATGGVPDVDYSFVRIGVDARLRLAEKIFVSAVGGYRMVSNPGDGSGEVAGDVNPDGQPPFFPSDQADGVDLGVALDYMLTPDVGLRATGDMRYYFHDFNVTPENQVVTGDNYGYPLRPVAGGATDVYFKGAIGVIWYMAGSDG